MIRPVAGAALLLALAAPGRADLVVRSEEALREAVAKARPGTRIEVAPGNYRGGFRFAGIRGAKNRPVVIAAADPARPPEFRGGICGMQLSNPRWVRLENLVFSGATGNGLNIDDGGARAGTDGHHVVLAGIVIRDVGPRGNRDGIKLSGIRDFLVERCRIDRWGDRGSGVDMVGCHDGKIVRCVFRNQDLRGANGVQVKGGSTNVLIAQCRFEHAGMRAIQLGGSTGRAYFRPPLAASGNAEARRIKVAGCEVIGSQAAIAYVSCEDCSVERCTIYRPTRWVLRILPGPRSGDFVPCRNGRFTDSIVVWRDGELRRTVNIGPGTEPASFVFAGNWWYVRTGPDAAALIFLGAR